MSKRSLVGVGKAAMFQIIMDFSEGNTIFKES